MKRSDFLIDPNVTFLNHGSFGACPAALCQEQASWQQVLEHEPVAYFHALPMRMQHARQRLAEFVDANPADLVYVTNSTYGANVMAFSMARHLRAGDTVLMSDHEYGACRRAWEMHLAGTGIEVQTCHIPMPLPSQEELEELIWASVVPSTKAIFISHITSPTANCMPVKGLSLRCREAGILLLVDGAHALGHVQVSLRDLDADMYTSNCHKWMCAPKGSAMFWVRPELQQSTLPVVRSWGDAGLSVGDGSFVDEHEYTGTRDASPFLTVPATIDWMGSSWWHMVSACHELVRYGMTSLLEIDGLAAMSADWQEQGLMMGAVLLPSRIDAPELQRTLLQRHSIQVVCMQWLNRPLLRFSVHGYTTKVELDRLVGAVRQELSQ